MRILVAQIDPTIGDFSGNLKKILKIFEIGRQKKVDIVLLPEMTICGYPPEDFVLHPSFVKACQDSLERLIPKTQGIMAVVGLVRPNLEKQEKPLFNSAAILQDAKDRSSYLRRYLATCRICWRDAVSLRPCFRNGKTQD